MEILKKAAAVLLLAAGLYSAVSAETVQEKAFEDSYKKEYSEQYNKAIDAITLVYNENSYAMNLRLGWLYYLSGSFRTSADYYFQAVRLLPNSIEARLGYVLPLSSMKKWELVINQYKEILKIDPANSVVHYRLGLVYYNNNDFKTASTYIEKTASMYPFDYDTTILNAWINYKLSNYSQARALFRKALLIRPGNESAQQGLKMVK